MHAIAFICSVNGQKAAGIIVQVLLHDDTGQPTLLAQGITNSDGYVLFNYVPVNVVVDVYATGPVTLNFVEKLTLGSENKNYDILLTASFKPPSRDRIINVMANLCNLRDADDIPIFDIFISSLLRTGNLKKALDWVNRIKKSGGTHINLALSYDYNENLGWIERYPIEGSDFSQNLDEFGSIISWCQQQNLIPIVKLAFDGHGYDPVGWTYGWQWGMDNLQRIVDGLSQFRKAVLWSTGFDGCFATWTQDELLQMIRYMRQVLGEDACIDTEFNGPGTWGYIHLGDGAASWTPDKLGILDHFSLEGETYPVNLEGLQQIATRLLGPNCLIGPKTPYYLSEIDKYIAIDYYETNAYWSIRKLIQPQDAVATANIGKSYGFTVFGNGIPT
jgi:pentatricopeptide repeat protein